MRATEGARAGQALVEFALTLPLVLLVVLGTVQLLLAAYVAWIVLPGAVQDGATVAGQRSADPALQLERGRQRALGLIAGSGAGAMVTDLEVSATDLDGQLIEVRASGRLWLIAPVVDGPR